MKLENLRELVIKKLVTENKVTRETALKLTEFNSDKLSRTRYWQFIKE